jgi:hypothetical protein
MDVVHISGTWTDVILALEGEPVFLKTAVGFAGESSFDEPEIEELIHPEVQLAGNAGVAQCLRQFTL